jgi:hypothetical protein
MHPKNMVPNILSNKDLWKVTGQEDWLISSNKTLGGDKGVVFQYESG